jgi:hypothetical protein
VGKGGRLPWPTRRSTIYGATCILPFVFKGVTYHDCAITEDSHGWCDATDGFFVQRQYCAYAASSSPTPLTPYCLLAETLSATWAAATFTDGSEDQTPYAPSSTCEWTLLPSNGGRVELTLLKLDTEVGLDVIRVLDATTRASLVPGGLSGSAPDLPKVGMAQLLKGHDSPERELQAPGAGLPKLTNGLSLF